MRIWSRKKYSLRSLWPRSLRGQLVVSLILLELAVLSLFALLLLRAERSELRVRTDRRMDYEARISAAQMATALRETDSGALAEIIAAAQRNPGVQAIELVDPRGRVLAGNASTNLAFPANALARATAAQKPILLPGRNHTAGVIAAARSHGTLYGFVLIVPSVEFDRQDLHATLRISFLIAILALAGCTLVGGILASSIAQPLTQLLEATRQLTRNPEDKSAFPLPVRSENEVGELTFAFNRLIHAVREQRANSRETLALLDSILANAPIGFAFFDRKCHLVRVNHFLAQMNELPINRYSGKTAREVFPGQIGQRLEQAVEQVLDDAQPVRDLELSSEWHGSASRTRTWLVNVYPIHTEAQEVRWVGAVLVDATDRKQAEDALRKTEKLAAAGRLAASIAHEINNPLEAVTNLLFLIRQSPMDEEITRYVEMAQHEVARVSEIAQQTLRFYRQSTLPTTANVRELMDSVLALHQGRLTNLQIKVDRQYEASATLFCFAGELRQLFTNLVSNAVDAMMPGGGRLTLRIRTAKSPGDGQLSGIRVTIADTGCGIDADSLRRIFEPFYTTKDATGTGLGLWVSAEILRKHQATIAVRSRAAVGGSTRERSGTVFSIFFPHLTEQKGNAKQAS
jgi:PAS domain S-box-containing protein